MAKQPDDHDSQHMTDGPKTNNPSPPPTRIAPYQADAPSAGEPDADEIFAAELLADEPVPVAKPVHAGYVPNLSLDEPAHSPPDPSEQNALEGEPVLAEKASEGSSVIEVAEIVDEHSEAHDVLADEAGHGPRASSVVEAAELAEVVEDSDVFTDETTDGSSVVSATALLADSAIVPPSGASAESSVVEALPASDVVMSAEEVMPDEVISAQEASGVVPAPATPPPVLAKPPMHELENQDTIYTKPKSGVEEALPAHLDEETVDLGSDLHLATAGPEYGKKEGLLPADMDVQATDEIDWDDVGPLADSKVVKQDEDASHVVTFEAEAEVDEPEEVTDEELPAAEERATAERSKTGEPSQEVVFDDMDAEAMAAEALHDEQAAKGTPGAGHTGDLAAFLDEEEMALAKKPTHEEEAAPIAKKKKDMDAVVAGAALAKPVAKRSFAGSWVGGMAVSILVLLGGAAALWYFSPDVLKGVYEASPGYVAPRKNPAMGTMPKTVQPLAVQARALMDDKNYAQAADLLKDADNTPANVSTRAEARWLKYLQEKTEAKEPLDKDAPEVKEVLADLSDAGNSVLATQIKAVINGGKGDGAEIARLKDRADKAEKQLSGVAEVLAKEKIINEKDNLDPETVRKVLKDMAESRGDIATVNKLLADANIKDGGNKGVAILVAAKKDADEKLDSVNKLLADAKIAGTGAKGIEELIEARNKLAKDRDELDQALKGAYEELAAIGLAVPGEDPRAKIVEAVKNVRMKAESLAKLLEERAGAAQKPAPALDSVKAPKQAPKAAQQEAMQAPKAPQQEAAPVLLDPALGEEHFGKGLGFFWSRRYREAEGQFRQAIRSFDQDARFYYFLGMSLLSQGDSQAAGAVLEQGARLEAANRPSPGEVNASLERVQGSLRAWVNAYRQRVTRVAAN